MSLEGLITVAKGEAQPDLTLKNARVVNTFTAEIEQTNVAIYEGRIAGIGDYDDGREVIDLRGKYLAPGLIDGHIHIESSMLAIGEYARAVIPRGVSGVVTDLHEIANVSGLSGMKYMLEGANGLPLDLYLMVPSCVPATSLETSGAELSSREIEAALGWENSIGLGEVMNFPGVLSGDEEVLRKITISKGRVIDGHAPSLGGKELNAYIASGILSDHESTTFDEGREKLSRGMYLMIREGSSEKNLDELRPLVTDNTYKRCLFVVDDRSSSDLLRDGDVDAVVRKAIRMGLNPIRAIQMATINPAEYFHLGRVGAVAPGYIANLIAFDDLSSFDVNMVFYRGRLVARDGEPTFSPFTVPKSKLTHTMNIKPFGIESLRLAAKGRTFPVIEVIPGQIITRSRVEEVEVRDGFILPQVEGDILKLVVVERHRATGNIGLGLVQGFGLKKGAMASSIAHDSHNIVCVGTNDEDIYLCIKEIERLQGGLVIASGGMILGSLALPIAGLLSEEPLETVVDRLEGLERIASGLGCPLPSPFSTLSFVALPVIPELRLTDKGIVDVVKSRIIG